MLDIFVERFRQKKRTVAYPAALPALPPRFRGRPVIDETKCLGLADGTCTTCADICPVRAIILDDGPALDMGMCVFCGDCARVCPGEALVFTTDWRLASTSRKALIQRPMTVIVEEREPLPTDIAQSVPGGMNKVFHLSALELTPTEELAGAFVRSLRLRQVSAAGCGACEADLNVLSTIVFDIARFGLDFVASPRHADAMALTGPVPRNMREALSKCQTAMAEPRLILAVGACAISGGVFRNIPENSNKGQERALLFNVQRADGAQPHIQPQLYIPGCPPHPYTILDGILRYIGRLSYG